MPTPHNAQEQNQQSTWITSAEASVLLGIKQTTVIRRINRKIYCGETSKGMPYSSDGKPVYIVQLESLPQSAQTQYHKNHQRQSTHTCLNLLYSRLFMGETYSAAANTATTILKEVQNIRKHYRSTGCQTQKMMQLAKNNGMSLPTLYRFTGSKASAQARPYFEDPVLEHYPQPRTMCFKSMDCAISLFLKEMNKTEVFRALQETTCSCKNCEFKLDTTCKKARNQGIFIPNGIKTVSRFLSAINPQLKYLYNHSQQEFIARYGLFALRKKLLLFNELWEGDHCVLPIRILVKVKRQKKGRQQEKALLVHPVFTAWIDTATRLYTGHVISIIPNSDTIADAFISGIRQHGIPRNIRTDCGKDYQSTMLKALPKELQSNFPQEEAFLNKHFAGYGILPSFGVQVNSAMPNHPQAKPCIERSFRILERIVENFYSNKTVPSFEEFMNDFEGTILPEYQNTSWSFSKEEPEEEWETALKDLSPIERKQKLPSAGRTIPDEEDLALLRFHRKDSCRVSSNGIRFSNCNYYHKELERFTGPDGAKVTIFYNRVLAPLVPRHISVVYNNTYICEATAMEELCPNNEEPSKYLEYIDARNNHISELNKSIKRITRSAEAVLPNKYKHKKVPTIKDQLRNVIATKEDKPQRPLNRKKLKNKTGSVETIHKTLSKLTI